MKKRIEDRTREGMVKTRRLGTGRSERREAPAATWALAPRYTLSGSMPDGRPGDVVDPPLRLGRSLGRRSQVGGEREAGDLPEPL